MTTDLMTFIYGLFNDIVNGSDHTGRLEIKEFGKCVEGSGRGLIYMSRHLCGGTEDDHEETQHSRCPGKD
jgi:hypothetical protein